MLCPSSIILPILHLVAEKITFFQIFSIAMQNKYTRVFLNLLNFFALSICSFIECRVIFSGKGTSSLCQSGAHVRHRQFLCKFVDMKYTISLRTASCIFEIYS